MTSVRVRRLRAAQAATAQMPLSATETRFWETLAPNQKNAKAATAILVTRYAWANQTCKNQTVEIRFGSFSDRW